MHGLIPVTCLHHRKIKIMIVVVGGVGLNEEQVRVVVVDDALHALHAVVNALAANGYSVRGASDGQEALRMVDAFKPHCVLFDIAMPGMDGLELAKQLRQAYDDSLVLIAITGLQPHDEKVSATFELVDYWWTKPVDLGKLQQIFKPAAPV
jgi:CheY-like chemotaxis protein